jgi:hypothetical protein
MNGNTHKMKRRTIPETTSVKNIGIFLHNCDRSCWQIRSPLWCTDTLERQDNIAGKQVEGTDAALYVVQRGFCLTECTFLVCLLISGAKMTSDHHPMSKADVAQLDPGFEVEGRKEVES